MLTRLTALKDFRLARTTFGLMSKTGRASHSHEAGHAGKKSVLVAIANGSEELEAVTVIDVLARAGAEVVVGSANELNVVCSRGVKLTADCRLADVLHNHWDLIVCPGGLPGAQHLSDSRELIQILRNQVQAGKPVAAICAAPALVLAHHGFLDGVTATCYPGSKFTSKIERFVSQKVVEDGLFITSQGPATALPFSLKLVEILYGSEKADQIRSDLLA